MELEGTKLMDARRAAFRDRIPAELDIVGIEIPAGSRGWLLQDSIAASHDGRHGRLALGD
jgi:hypothetical protein